MSVRANWLYSMKRKTGANRRYSGDDEGQILTKDKVFRCPNCGSVMEYWKEDHMGDIIMSCTNHFCYKSKDFAGSLTVELKKLTKQLQQNSRKFYRKYDGTHY